MPHPSDTHVIGNGKSPPSVQSGVQRGRTSSTYCNSWCLGGLVAGIIAGGIGSRVAKCIVVIIEGSADQSAMTETQARVGEITAEATLLLVVFPARASAYWVAFYTSRSAPR